MTEPVALESILSSLRGVIPSPFATCAADGRPNVTYLSIVQLVDVRRMVGVASFLYILLHLILYIADQVFDWGKVVSEIVLRAGVSTELHVFAGACHGFDSLLPDWPGSQRLFSLQGDALSRAFYG